MLKRFWIYLACAPILGACSAGGSSTEVSLSDSQLTTLNGYKCMIKEGLISKKQAFDLIQVGSRRDNDEAYYAPVFAALRDGVSQEDYQRSEAEIAKSKGCKNVALAWMAVNLGTEKTSEIVADLQSKGWFDKTR
jgi:uncharacterized protein YegL